MWNIILFSVESEICDLKLMEARHNYAKRALKTLFNGSQKTFQVRILYVYLIVNITFHFVHIKLYF